MATTAEPASDDTPTRPSGPSRTPAAARALEGKKARPVLFWAALGTFFVCLQFYIYTRWIASSDFTRTDTGPDPLPTATQVWVVGFQVLSVVLALVFVVWVVRQSLRERRLSFDAMLVIAWMSLYWQDPLLNYFRQQFFYNSGMINFGSWTEQIPGWISPQASQLPEPVLFVGVIYLWLGPLSALMAFGIMRAVKRRRPETSVFALLVSAWAVLFFWDILCEVIFIRTELYAYNGAIHGLSIFGGERYQFPVYEAFFWPMVWTAMGAIRFFRDDRGRTFLDRGLDRVRASRRNTTGLRLLAIIGFANLAMIIYTVPIWYSGMHAGRTPEGYPSYLTNEMCGEGTDYACTAPEIPIPLPGSGNVDPDGGLVPPS
ncbi:MAG: spirocyclase AveC family protein [Acidimicrobiia bacterium]